MRALRLWEGRLSRLDTLADGEPPRDPEGHLWFFAQPTRAAAPEEWGATVTGG